MGKKTVTIRVTLENEKVIKVEIPKGLSNESINFFLNSKYGTQGWLAYSSKIKKSA
jgi:hypothetical protein